MPKTAGEKIFLSRRGLNLINRLDRWAALKSWQGGMHPDEWDRIERGYNRARRDMARFISELEGHAVK